MMLEIGRLNWHRSNPLFSSVSAQAIPLQTADALNCGAKPAQSGWLNIQLVWAHS
jgi:hypothetical protein